MPFTPHPSMIKKPENCNHRGMFKSVGYSDADLERPMIGIANAWSEVVPGHTNLRQVAEYVKRGIYRAGGTAVEFGTIGCCDGIAQGAGMFAILPTREIIANSVEMMVTAHNLDAIVLLGSCDKVIPGMMMAAARLKIPAILLPGGPMQGGVVVDNRASDATALSEAVGMIQTGRLKEDDIYFLEEACVPTCGSCSFYGTANTMCCVSEVMGLTPYGTATIPAYKAARLRAGEYAGERIVALVKEGITADQILTKDAIENAIIYVNATGGSTNAVLHLAALGYELGIPSEEIMELFAKHEKTVPQILKIYPAGTKNMEDYDLAGGVPQIMKSLRSILYKEGMTVDGVTTGELIAQTPEARYNQERLIRTMDDPYSVGSGIAIVKGNLAPLGGVTKPAAIAEEQRVFTGKAKVFDSEEDANDAILGGRIHAGDVVVIRYEGPKGGPGMREMCNAMKYLHGLGLGTTTALITDGRFSGTNNGCFVGHISPEAAEGGPIAAVQDGDEITLDIPANTITLHVSDEEIEARLKKVKMPAPRFTSGYLAHYSRHASSASEGAVLK